MLIPFKTDSTTTHKIIMDDNNYYDDNQHVVYKYRKLAIVHIKLLVSKILLY